MTVPTYHDYLWLQPYLDKRFAFGYCVAVIPGRSPAEVLSLLGAASSHSDSDVHLEAVGVAEVGEVELDLADQAVAVGFGGVHVIAVAAIDGDNTLLIQLNGGSFAVTEALMRPLLPEHEVVAHSLSVNADSQFIWWSNGERVAAFELFGSGPVIGDERVVDLIWEVGGIGIDDDALNEPGEHAMEGAFALAERITGVAVTAELFEAGPFTVAVVPGEGRTLQVDRPAAPIQNPPSQWREVARRYKAAERIPLHGMMFKERPPGGRPSAELEFWFKPRTCIRLADDEGVLFLQNRQKQTWFRTDGVLEVRSGGYSLDIHITQLLQIHRTWPDARFADLLPPDTAGRAVEVNGRRAWEFEMPPDWAGLDSTVAFDEETGIPLRWKNKTCTHEISELETGIDMGDGFFTGP